MATKTKRRRASGQPLSVEPAIPIAATEKEMRELWDDVLDAIKENLKNPNRTAFDVDIARKFLVDNRVFKDPSYTGKSLAESLEALKGADLPLFDPVRV